MESSGRFEQLFFKVLKEEMTAGAGGAFGDGPSTHDISKYAEGDARVPKVLGKGKVQTRKGTTGGKKKKKKKTDGLDEVFLTGEEGEEGPSFTLDDVLESGMEILGDYGAWEANLRGPETVDAGVESLKELVEYYLAKLGLTDTDAEYYKKRHETYQAIWDENMRLNKELLGHADRDERKDQEILNQRYNAMILAAMNAPQEGEEGRVSS